MSCILAGLQWLLTSIATYLHDDMKESHKVKATNTYRKLGTGTVKESWKKYIISSYNICKPVFA